MAYNEILASEIAEGSTLDNATLTKIKDNFVYLKAQSGGGGGALEFSLNEVPSPTEEQVSGFSVLTFEQIAGAKCKLTIKVPSGYAGGVIPVLNFVFFSPNNVVGNNVGFKATTELLESNDSFASNAGSFVATKNTEDNNNANALTLGTINLANTNGVINGVAIEANDILAITLERIKTDDVSEDVYLVPSLTGVDFTE